MAVLKLLMYVFIKVCDTDVIMALQVRNIGQKPPGYLCREICAS